MFYPLLQQFAHQFKQRVNPRAKVPWCLYQRWENLLFAHWPIAVEAIRPFVPRQMEIDLYDGQAWVTLVPFHVVDLHLGALPPLPGACTFPQINFRTYVRVNQEPGVFFFSLDADNPPAVLAARQFFHVPYFQADMVFCQGDQHFSIHSQRYDATQRETTEFSATYEPIGPIYQARSGTLDQFLVERAVLFAEGPGGHLYRGEVRHPAWLLQGAKVAIRTNTIPRAAGIVLPAGEPFCHFAARTDGLISPVLPLFFWR